MNYHIACSKGLYSLAIRRDDGWIYITDSKYNCRKFRPSDNKHRFVYESFMLGPGYDDWVPYTEEIRSELKFILKKESIFSRFINIYGKIRITK